MASNGNTQALVPLFAVGVFMGFTLSQLGMVRHWYTQRSRVWMSRAVINGVGAFLTTATTIIELISKFTEGAWLQPPRFWDYLLFNQRGVILDRAIRRGTANVVLCRLRYRLEQFAPRDVGPASAAGTDRPAAAPPVIAPPPG